MFRGLPDRRYLYLFIFQWVEWSERAIETRMAASYSVHKYPDFLGNITITSIPFSLKGHVCLLAWCLGWAGNVVQPKYIIAFAQMHVSGQFANSRIVFVTQHCFHAVYNNLPTHTNRGNDTTARPTAKRSRGFYIRNIVENWDDGWITKDDLLHPMMMLHLSSLPAAIRYWTVNWRPLAFLTL